MQKGAIIVLISLVLLLIAGIPIPNVQAGISNEYVLFEDDFDDLSNVYADTYGEECYTSGGALINNETDIKVFGFHPVPQCYIEIHLTITYETLQSCGYYIILESGADRRTRWDYGADPTTKESGIAMSLNEIGWDDTFTVYKSYNGSFTNHYTKTNLHIEQHDLNLTIYFDGINHKQSVWLNDTLCVDNENFYNYEPYVIDNTTITFPPLVFNYIRFKKSGSKDSPYQLLEIDSIKQYISSSEKVNGVAGKFVSLGFDAMYDEVLANGFDELTALSQYASMMSDQYYQSSSSASLTWGEVQSMGDSYDWEMGMHYNTQLTGENDYETVMDNEYNWIQGNTSIAPLSFSVMAGASNWSHASYGWTDLNMIAREWHVPTGQGKIADASATFMGGSTEPTDAGYVIHQNSLDKNLRSWFTWTHKLLSSPSANDCDLEWFIEFIKDLDDADYRIVPLRLGYNSLIYSFNSSFSIITDTSDVLEFSVSSDASEVYVWANKPTSDETYYCYNNLNEKIRIREDFSDKIGFWVEDGQTYTIQTSKIDRSIDSCSPYYADILTHSTDEDTLTFSVSAPSGNTTEIDVYCGDDQRPEKVTLDNHESPSWTYDEVTRLCSFSFSHDSTRTIVVDWGRAGAIGTWTFGVRVHVSSGMFPWLGAYVVMNGENKSTDILGDAYFDVAYGSYDVLVFCGDENETRSIFVSGDMSVGFDFEKSETRDRGIFIIIGLPIGLIILLFVGIFLWRKK